MSVPQCIRQQSIIDRKIREIGVRQGASLRQWRAPRRRLVTQHGVDSRRVFSRELTEQDTRGSSLNGKLAVVLLFLPPALLLFTLFVALPMGEAAWYSVYNWNGYGTPENFVGLKNYEVLFQDRAFRTALVNNLLIIAVSLAIQLPLALAMAILLADRFRGAVMFRMIFFVPYILAEVAAGLIWRFVCDGDYGLVAKIATTLGFVAPYVLADRDLAMHAILVVIVWKYFGFHMMLYIAGLPAPRPPHTHQPPHPTGTPRRP